MTINQSRRTKAPPGLMIYPSDLLSKREYRMMGAEERALLFSITLECWVNESVPASLEQLSIIVGLSTDIVSKGLTKNVRHFLDESNGDFTMPDVERYRAEAEERRRKLSAGGKKGMRKRWAEDDMSTDNLVNKPLNKKAITSRDRAETETETESVMSVSNQSWADEYDAVSNGA